MFKCRSKGDTEIMPNRNIKMIKLSTLNDKTLERVLAKNNISISRDADSDEEYEIKHELEENFSTYIKIDKGNEVLRIYGIDHNLLRERRPALKNNDLLEVVNMVNIGSNVIKYSSISNIAIAFEYGIPLIGEISEDHLIKMIAFINDEVAVLGEIFDEFHKLTRKIKKMD